MRSKKGYLAAICVLSVSVLLLPAGVSAKLEKARTIKPCLECHKKDKSNFIRGKLSSVSMKAETIKINTGPGGKTSWLVKFDEDTKLKGAKTFNKVKKGKEVLAKFNMVDGQLYASSFSVKKPAKIKPEMVLKVDQVKEIVAKGSEKGNYLMVDARPAPKYLQGHIPGSISIYNAAFKKNIDKLPKDKNKLLIYYCGGPT